MSVYRKSSWPRWAHSVSHTRVTVERGIKFGIDQNRDAAANCWRLAPWLMPAARRRHPRFFGHFDRLFDRLPVRISTSDLHHWILRKKIFHIRAYDFGVQFSFNFSIQFSISSPVIVRNRRIEPKFGLLNVTSLITFRFFPCGKGHNSAKLKKKWNWHHNTLESLDYCHYYYSIGNECSRTALRSSASFLYEEPAIETWRNISTLSWFPTVVPDARLHVI